MTEKNLDKDWIHMIMEAKQMGIPRDEIRMFLQQASDYEKAAVKKEL